MPIVTPLTNMNADPSALVQNSSTANLLSSIVSSVQIISNSVSTTSSTVVGDAVSGGAGALVLKTKSASVTCSNGFTETISIQIPANSMIVATQLRNDTNIVLSGGGTSYSADYGIGNIAALIGITKNTKVDAFWDVANFSPIVGASPVDIILTPDQGRMVSGTITAVTYYYELTSLPNL